MIRRIYPTRFGQMHLRSNDGKGVPLVLLHMSPRSGAMWQELQEKLDRPTHAPDRLGYGFSDAPPWALSMEQYAQSTVDGLKAAGMQGPIDLMGVHTGSIEAIEIAHLLGSQVRRVIVVGMPLFNAEEQQRQLEKYSEQPLRPAGEGGHVLAAWRVVWRCASHPSICPTHTIVSSNTSSPRILAPHFAPPAATASIGSSRP